MMQWGPSRVCLSPAISVESRLPYPEAGHLSFALLAAPFLVSGQASLLLLLCPLLECLQLCLCLVLHTATEESVHTVRPLKHLQDRFWLCLCSVCNRQSRVDTMQSYWGHSQLSVLSFVSALSFKGNARSYHSSRQLFVSSKVSALSRTQLC